MGFFDFLFRRKRKNRNKQSQNSRENQGDYTSASDGIGPFYPHWSAQDQDSNQSSIQSNHSSNWGWNSSDSTYNSDGFDGGSSDGGGGDGD